MPTSDPHSPPVISDPPDDRVWKFSELTADPAIRDRWEKVRKYFFLRESTYDMTRRCNIRCNGCYYYEGDKQHTKDEVDPEKWRALMAAEKERGITFVVLAGAEPSLVPELLAACHDVIPLGAIATNGLVRIPSGIGYRVHISVWGNDATSLKVRNARDMLARQMDHYRGDGRAVFVYTFTRDNIRESEEVVEALSRNGLKVTFNVFSKPVGYAGALHHTPESLAETGRTMRRLLSEYPDHVLFSDYSAMAHTHARSLNDLFRCPYPRRNPSTDLGLGRTFRQYRTDLTWDREAACCVPDTDCDDCRHYAAGSAVVTSRLYRHAIRPDIFGAWLDYVDTYLAVWVAGYEKSPNLIRESPQPPGPKKSPDPAE